MKNFILISNHQSYFDPAIVTLVVGRHPYFMAKEELFKVPVFSTIIKVLKTIPVRRRQPDKRAVSKILNLLRRGESVLIFPEGTRSNSNRVGDFQKGINFIASKSNIPVLPIYIKNSFKAWQKGKIFPKFFVSISVCIGDIIYYNESFKNNFNIMIRKRIGKLSKHILRR